MADKSRIPRSIKDFHDYLNNTAAYLTAADSTGLENWDRLSLLEAEKDQWVQYKDDFNTIWPSYSNKSVRSTSITNQVRDIQKNFIQYDKDEKLLKRIEASPNVSIPDLEMFHIKSGPLRDDEPTPRQAITTQPSVTLKPKGGGKIHIECRVESDSSRPSMHPDADVVEMRYKVGDPPPETPAAALSGFNSSRSNWAQQLDMGDLGKRLYGYARWVNNSDATKNGPWSERFQVIVA